jgi:hypothetical protein
LGIAAAIPRNYHAHDTTGTHGTTVVGLQLTGGRGGPLTLRGSIGQTFGSDGHVGTLITVGGTIGVDSAGKTVAT